MECDLAALNLCKKQWKDNKRDNKVKFSENDNKANRNFVCPLLTCKNENLQWNVAVLIKIVHFWWPKTKSFVWIANQSRSTFSLNHLFDALKGYVQR